MAGSIFPKNRELSSSFNHIHRTDGGFGPAFLIGLPSSSPNCAFLRVCTHDQIPSPLQLFGQSPTLDLHASCVHLVGTVRSFAFGTRPSHALHQFVTRLSKR